MFKNKNINEHLYHLALNKKDLKIFYIKLILIIITYIICLLFCGFNRFYGMLYMRSLKFIYILEVVCFCSIFSSIFNLIFNNGFLTDRNIDRSINSFSKYSFFLILFNLISIILSIVYVLKEGFHNDVTSFLLYIFLNILTILVSLYFKHITKNVYVEVNAKKEY